MLFSACSRPDSCGIELRTGFLRIIQQALYSEPPLTPIAAYGTPPLTKGDPPSGLGGLGNAI